MTTVLEARAADVAAGLAACRSCGCTPNVACDGGCCWIDDDLCSTCAVVVALSEKEALLVVAALQLEASFWGGSPAEPAVRAQVELLISKFNELAPRTPREAPIESAVKR